MGRPPVSYPDPLDDALRDRFKAGEGLTFDRDLTDEQMRWWNERFGPLGLFPREMADRLANGLPEPRTYRVTLVDPLREHVRVEVRVLAEDGATLIVSDRSIEFDNEQIHLNKTSIRDDLQGLRHGRRLLRNAFSLAMDLELPKLALTALMHGPWVWPRAGFLPDPGDWASGETQGKIVQQLYRLPPGEIRQDRREALRGFIERGDRNVVRTLALLRDQVRSSRDPRRRVKLGWYLLAEGEASWKGSLRLDDEEAVRRLRCYLAAGGVPL